MKPVLLFIGLQQKLDTVSDYTRYIFESPNQYCCDEDTFLAKPICPLASVRSSPTNCMHVSTFKVVHICVYEYIVSVLALLLYKV